MNASLVPPWADPFLPREPVMADMAAWVRTCRDHGRPALIYVQGLEGLGVSCLVTKFSRTYSEFVDLPMIWLTGRRADGTAVPVGELLSRALRQLRVPESDQGPTDEDKADSLRIVSRGRRFLVVVDDMDNAAQLVPFVLHDAPDTIVIATSAIRRRELEQRGFEPFSPELLSDDAARSLFRSELRETAAALDSETVDSLVEFCGGLPLLVRVLAAQIRGRVPMARRLLAQLRESKMALLDLDDEQRMRRFLDAAINSLTDGEATAYRRLGLLPATDVSVAAAAAVLGLDSDTAYTILEQLTELNLLTVDATRSRYAFHPVLRDDARIRAEAVDGSVIRRRTLHNWVLWCLREALPRAAVISDRWWVAPVTVMLNSLYPNRIPQFTRDQAVEWFDLEWMNVIAAVRAAHRAELHDLTWMMCVVSWKYLHLHGYYGPWIETHQIALASAEMVGAELGVMQLTSQLGAAYLELIEFALARDCFDKSLRFARQAQHVLGEQSALEWLGKVAATQGRYADALELYRQSWEVVEADTAQTTPDERARAFAILLLQRARARYRIGDYDDADEDARKAIVYFDGLATETDNSAKARQILGRVLLARQHISEAITELEAARERFAKERVLRHQADTQRLLGDAHRAAGDHTAAADWYRQSLDYYRAMGNPQASEVEQAIADLSRDGRSS